MQEASRSRRRRSGGPRSGSAFLIVAAVTGWRSEKSERTRLLNWMTLKRSWVVSRGKCLRDRGLGLLDRLAGHRTGRIDDKRHISRDPRHRITLPGGSHQHQQSVGFAVALLGQDRRGRFLAENRMPGEVKVSIGRNGVFAEGNVMLCRRDR